MNDDAALRAKFEQFDPHGSGLIGETEFIAIVRKLGLKISDAKASRAYLSLDSNDDGRIRFDQLRAWWFKYDRS